jgi:RNA polymerase sigma-70 factor (ECF subfamily)
VKPLPRIDASAATGDAELLARVAAGELGALGALYDRHRDSVRGFVARATCGHADADDLVHDAFLTAARIAARFDGRDCARPWLIGIAARLVQRRARGLGRIPRILARLAWARPQVSDPVEVLEARSALGAVAPAVARMTTGKRIVLLMAELEGMTGPEIAEALEIPIGTVWTRLHHARRELMDAICEARTP